MKAASTPPVAPGMQVLCLLIALSVMAGGTAYPALLLTSDGKVDHGLATAIFWAMSAGFVSGVGFIPETLIWRWIFSCRACLATLMLAILLKFFL